MSFEIYKFKVHSHVNDRSATKRDESSRFIRMFYSRAADSFKSARDEFNRIDDGTTITRGAQSEGVLAARQWCMRQAWHISIRQWNPRPHSRSDNPPFSLSLSLTLSSYLSIYSILGVRVPFSFHSVVASLSRLSPTRQYHPRIDYDTRPRCTPLSSIACRLLGISMLISCDVWLNGGYYGPWTDRRRVDAETEQ